MKSSSVPNYSRYQDHFSTQVVVMERKLVFLEYCAHFEGGKIAVKAITRSSLRTLLSWGAIGHGWKIQTLWYQDTTESSVI